MIPMDISGEYCGIDNNKPYLLLLNFKDLSILSAIMNTATGKSQIVTSATTCVARCPTHYGEPTTSQNMCIKGLNIRSKNDLDDAIKDQICASFNIPTTPVLSYCVPDFSKIYDRNVSFNDFVNIFGKSHVFKIINTYPHLFERIKIVKECFNEFKTIIPYLPINLLTCILIAIIFLFIFSRGIYQIFIILYFVSLIICFGGYAFIKIQHNKINVTVNFDDNLKWMYNQLNTVVETSNSWAFDYLEWILLIIGIILFFSGCFLHNVIKTACRYAKEVSKAIRVLLENIIIPLISAILQIGSIILCIYVLLCIITSDKNSYKFLTLSNGKVKVGDKCEKYRLNSRNTPGCLFAGKYVDHLSKIFIFIAVFVSLWNILIARGISTYLIACSYVNYFTKKEENKSLGATPLFLEGIKGLFMYNMGSIMFGSFLIAVLLAISYMLKIILKIFKIKETGYIGAGVKFIRKCMLSIVLFMKKLNEKAYIQVVVCQKNFLKSTFQVVSIFVSHPVISLTIVSFNTFYQVFGTVAVSILNGFLAYFILTKILPNLQFLIFHSIIIGIFSMLPSCALLSIYTTGITTKQYIDYYNESRK